MTMPNMRGLELGYPGEKILEFAGEEGCDMIVMASLELPLHEIPATPPQLPLA